MLEYDYWKYRIDIAETAGRMRMPAGDQLRVIASTRLYVADCWASIGIEMPESFGRPTEQELADARG